MDLPRRADYISQETPRRRLPTRPESYGERRGANLAGARRRRAASPGPPGGGRSGRAGARARRGLCPGALPALRGGPGRVSRFPPAACPFPVSFAALRRPVLPVPAPGGSGRAAPWGRSGLLAPRTGPEPPPLGGLAPAPRGPSRGGSAAHAAALCPAGPVPRAALLNGPRGCRTPPVAPPVSGLLFAPAPAAGGAPGSQLRELCAAHTFRSLLPACLLTDRARGFWAAVWEVPQTLLVSSGVYTPIVFSCTELPSPFWPWSVTQLSVAGSAGGLGHFRQALGELRLSACVVSTGPPDSRACELLGGRHTTPSQHTLS